MHVTSQRIAHLYVVIKALISKGISMINKADTTTSFDVYSPRKKKVKDLGSEVLKVSTSGLLMRKFVER